MRKRLKGSRRTFPIVLAVAAALIVGCGQTPATDPGPQDGAETPSPEMTTSDEDDAGTDDPGDAPSPSVDAERPEDETQDPTDVQEPSADAQNPSDDVQEPGDDTTEPVDMGMETVLLTESETVTEMATP